MSISYKQKREILSYMSEAGHWANVFDMDFFTDERRKWNTARTETEITLSSSPDRKSFLAIDEKAGGGSITLSKSGSDQLSIKDESSRAVKADKMGRQAAFELAEKGTGAPPEISDIASSNEIGLGNTEARLVAIPEIAAYIRFYDDHSKSVFLEDSGKKVVFGPPTVERDCSLHHGRFFHVVSFDLDQAAKWGLTPYGVLNGTKLIVSKDLSIEPDLHTLNELDPEKAAEYLAYLMREEWDENYQGPWQWRPKKIKDVGDLTHLQKQWTDSTEFSGYFIDTPKQFFVETTENGFNLATSLEHREAIWSQTALLHEAVEGAAATLGIVNTKISPRMLIHLLSKGDALEDHRERAWKCIVLKTKNTAEIAKDARAIARANFGLTSYHFAAMNFDDTSCLIAMDAEVLERVARAYDATIALLHLAKTGGRDAAIMERLFNAGADLRLVKPEEAQKGETFANAMQSAENYEMLADLKERYGVHDLTYSPDESEQDHQGPA